MLKENPMSKDKKSPTLTTIVFWAIRKPLSWSDSISIWFSASDEITAESYRLIILEDVSEKEKVKKWEPT